MILHFPCDHIFYVMIERSALTLGAVEDALISCGFSLSEMTLVSLESKIKAMQAAPVVYSDVETSIQSALCIDRYEPLSQHHIFGRCVLGLIDAAGVMNTKRLGDYVFLYAMPEKMPTWYDESERLRLLDCFLHTALPLRIDEGPMVRRFLLKVRKRRIPITKFGDLRHRILSFFTVDTWLTDFAFVHSGSPSKDHVSLVSAEGWAAFNSYPELGIDTAGLNFLARKSGLTTFRLEV